MVLENNRIRRGSRRFSLNSCVLRVLAVWGCCAGVDMTQTFSQPLVSNLSTLNWPETVKTLQQQWIGRSLGHVFRFKLDQVESYGVWWFRQGRKLVDVTTTWYGTYGSSVCLLFGWYNTLLTLWIDKQLYWSIHNKSWHYIWCLLCCRCAYPPISQRVSGQLCRFQALQSNSRKTQQLLEAIKLSQKPTEKWCSRR